MMIRFRAWCAKERVGRAEAGTSQDMCPTNGDTLFMFLWFAGWWSLVAVMFWLAYGGY
jgi:hypothetical protein